MTTQKREKLQSPRNHEDVNPSWPQWGETERGKKKRKGGTRIAAAEVLEHLQRSAERNVTKKRKRDLRLDLLLEKKPQGGKEGIDQQREKKVGLIAKEEGRPPDKGGSQVGPA